ncbi:MAG: hypothetical protein C5B50_11335 [Verrucomicrobia bacterium]|nr:MAG: hypothetical protein C5B50_11335 [Verrucomicrobiota bacterium]
MPGSQQTDRSPSSSDAVPAKPDLAATQESGRTVTRTPAAASAKWIFRIKVLLASIANLFVVSYIHYLTGYEFLFFVFYFVPVSLCGWYLGRGAVLFMSILTGVSWCIVDILSNHQYPIEEFRYANSFLCFVAFGSIGVLLQTLRQSLHAQSRARQELEKALEDLNRSTAEIRKLQGHLQVVCAWTKRINVEGRWITLDEFLKTKLNAQISYGVSPEAMQEVLHLDKETQAANS